MSEEPRQMRRLRRGQSVMIMDHPQLPSLVGKVGRAMQFPVMLNAPADAPGKPIFEGTEKTTRRVWVRLEGIDDIEYAIPFNCLLFEDEVEDEG